MPVKVKICGITNLEDAQAAVEAGADAIGFIFYEKSPRFIPIDEAAKIRRFINPFVHVVGVFVDPSYTFAREVMEKLNWILSSFTETNLRNYADYLAKKQSRHLESKTFLLSSPVAYIKTWFGFWTHTLQPRMGEPAPRLTGKLLFRQKR